jgi:hypothetical protein
MDSNQLKKERSFPWVPQRRRFVSAVRAQESVPNAREQET